MEKQKQKDQQWTLSMMCSVCISTNKTNRIFAQLFYTHKQAIHLFLSEKKIAKQLPGTTILCTFIHL